MDNPECSRLDPVYEKRVLRETRSSAIKLAIEICGRPGAKMNQAEREASVAGDWQQVIRAARDILAFLENG